MSPVHLPCANSSVLPPPLLSFLMAAPFSPPKPHHLFLNVAFVFLLSFFIASNLLPSSSPPLLSNPLSVKPGGCAEFDRIEDRDAKCAYLRSKNPCSPQGYIDYINLFYCVCGASPLAGYSVLALWLAVLFYLLGDTASVYFCFSLESLSRTLSLPPTVAGVTLLSLGNGAPDAFATIASFASSGDGDVGLSSVLGGAFFVTSGVVGLIGVCVGARSVPIDRFSFVREICFFMLVLCFLLAVLLVGEIGLVVAILFASLYIVYVAAVAVSYRWRRSRAESDVPLLESVEVEQPADAPKLEHSRKLPSGCVRVLRLLELPLYLPRRLTIPDVSEERWSKPFAVLSVVLAPLLLAALWCTKRGGSVTAYLCGGSVGMVMGVVALETTERTKAPNRMMLPWVAGEFVMSVVWFYMAAGELVQLLVSVGHVMGIGPSVLAATVLAWGNSVGDLMANVAMAVSGGEDGVQIAVSGCYAVPIFNTLVGLGLSLAFACWRAYPEPYVIPKDPTLMVTMGFMVGGLVWALVMVPRRGMRLDRVVGVGLLALYLCFLCLRVSDSIGLVQIDDLFLL